MMEFCYTSSGTELLMRAMSVCIEWNQSGVVTHQCYKVGVVYTTTLTTKHPTLTSHTFLTKHKPNRELMLPSSVTAPALAYPRMRKPYIQLLQPPNHPE